MSRSEVLIAKQFARIVGIFRPVSAPHVDSLANRQSDIYLTLDVFSRCLGCHSGVHLLLWGSFGNWRLVKLYAVPRHRRHLELAG